MDLYRKFKGLQRERYHIVEGSVSEDEAEYTMQLLQRHSIQKVMEIGFNGGLSCAAMLIASPDVHVTSFDLGQWGCVRPAADLMASQFTGRHSLVVGDSTVTLPAYDKSQHGAFDMVFLDGGHTAPVPGKDMANALPFLKPKGLIFMDDYCQTFGSQGVIQAYDDAVARGLIQTIVGPFSGEGQRGWIVAQKNS